jgi:hypothetical protein
LGGDSVQRHTRSVITQGLIIGIKQRIQKFVYKNYWIPAFGRRGISCLPGFVANNPSFFAWSVSSPATSWINCKTGRGRYRLDGDLALDRELFNNFTLNLSF